MSLKWTGDDDTLSMGMSSGSGFDHESLHKTHKGEFKKRGKQEKQQSFAAADQAHATRKAADTQRAVQFGQSIAQAAMMGAQIKASNAAKTALGAPPTKAQLRTGKVDQSAKAAELLKQAQTDLEEKEKGA